MKRKNSNVDDESVKPQKVKKSGSREGHSKAEKDGSNVGPLPKKKNWTKGFKLKKDNHKIMKRRRLETHKNTEKNKIKLSTSGNRTETLDKKHEARRKRRAKGKVMIMLKSSVEWFSVDCNKTKTKAIFIILANHNRQSS